MQNSYRISVGKAEGKIPLGRPRPRWENNIRMNLREMVWECVNWMHVAQEVDQRQALVNTVINFRIPLMAGNLLNELSDYQLLK
jgi:hypothetical protein